jgi:RimJ/RimL family protein N-acetyltransferase
LEFTGWCGLKYLSETNEVDLGYRFMKKFWGKGYATEAALACIEYGFSRLHLQKLLAGPCPETSIP